MTWNTPIAKIDRLPLAMLAAPPSHHLPGLIPQATQQVVPVADQVRLARDTWRLRLHAPGMARVVRPGQFFMIRSPGANDPLLARPFALYDTWVDRQGAPLGVDIVYLVVGRMTRLMSTWKAGDAVEVWGPLGNGFPQPSGGRLLLVAGGIGNTPFLAVAREALGRRAYFREGLDAGGAAEPLAAGNVVFCYGARTAEYLAGVDDFRALGIDVRLATDDGSAGRRGLVTQLVEEELARGAKSASTPDPGQTTLFCCGPEPMLRAAADMARHYGAPCWISLETPMACGFGACFSCVTRLLQPAGGWDYARVCVEGPVFRSDRWAPAYERL